MSHHRTQFVRGFRGWYAMSCMPAVWCAGAMGQTDTESGGGELVLPDYTSLLIRTLVTLGVMVVVLLLAAKYLPGWLRRLGPADRDGLIGVVESRRLEPGRTLHVVKVGERMFLIGSTAQGLSTLADVTPGADAGGRAPEGASFGTRLGRAVAPVQGPRTAERSAPATTDAA